MSLQDAVKLISYRRFFSDLPAALELIGYGLLPESADHEMARWTAEDRVAYLDLLAADEEMDAAMREIDGVDDDAWNWGHGELALEDAGVEDSEARRGVLPFFVEAANSSVAAEPAFATPMPASAAAVTFHDDTGEDVWRSLCLRHADIERLAKRRLAGASLDIARAVHRLAKLEVLDHLPLRKGMKISNRLQLVVDVSLMVGPYGADMRSISEQIRQFVGNREVSEIAFRHSLSRGCGSGPVWSWKSYRMPSAVSTVIFVSGNFGQDRLNTCRELELVTAELMRHGHLSGVIWVGELPESFERHRSNWVVVVE